MTIFNTVLASYFKLLISTLKDINVQLNTLLKFTLTCFTLCAVVIGYAQEERASAVTFNCGTDKLIEERYANDADYKRQQEAFELAYRTSVKNHNEQAGKKSQSSIFTIPSVVHIIHRGAPLGSVNNPDDETVRSIILEASDRFREQHAQAGTYANPFSGVDTEIELCLIDTDPDGNFTTGIIRHYSDEHYDRPTFHYLESLEYDNTLYKNFFITESLGSASAYHNGSSTAYTGFGFNPETICHEVGHYFSLAHTFQSGCFNNDCLVNGDRVCDTPPKVTQGQFGTYSGDCDSPANDCTTDEDDTSNNNPYRSIALGGMGDQIDMLENYMDYGSCRNSFSVGQKIRMHANINTKRTELINNSGSCNNGGMAQHDAGIIDASLQQDDFCDHTITAQVVLKNYGNSPLLNVDIVTLLENGSEFLQVWSGNLLTGETATATLDFPILNQDQLVKIFTRNPNNFGTDEFENNDTLFVPNVTYIGGSECDQFSACSPFNENTPMGPGNTTTVSLSSQFPDLEADYGQSLLICTTVEGSVNIVRLDVYDESGVFRGETNVSDVSGVGFSAPFCFEITFAEYDSWRADGEISITLDPQYQYISVIQACVDLHIAVGDSDLFGCPDATAHNYDSQLTYLEICETCSDGILNGDETGLDCGGILCERCILTTQPTCGADNATATIEDPNNEITNIQWDAAANNQTGLTAFELAEGNYSVTITELDGSTYTLETTITSALTEATQLDKIFGGEGFVYASFGNSISASQDWAVIGSESDHELASYSGAVYVYQIENGIKTAFQKLKASDFKVTLVLALK